MGLRAYRIQKTLELEPPDVLRRLDYAADYIRIMTANPNLLFLWSDEAAFSLSGSVATNTLVRYSVDREGRPRHFNFEMLRDKNQVTGIF